MMTDEQITGLIEKINNIIKQEPEFKERLKKELFGEAIVNLEFKPKDKSDNNNLTKSFDAFVKLQRNHCKKKARLFYDNISDSQLFADLVSSYSEMLWYKSIHETGRYFVFLNHQIENMMNHYCIKNDCWDVINRTPKVYDKYIHRYKDKVNEIVCGKKFFSEKDNKELDLKYIGLWPKIIFWAFHSNNREVLEKNYLNFVDIMNIRNLMCHSDSERPASDFRRIKKWENPEDVFSYGHLENILMIIKRTID